MYQWEDQYIQDLTTTYIYIGGVYNPASVAEYEHLADMCGGDQFSCPKHHCVRTSLDLGSGSGDRRFSSF